ncbi:uncharacterized protein LOC135345191 [Halichondria panicea]|uniref:uncharacterized protein LOC135345191 n=1 Tax=Halichondria panicea TaxID=6063 RepID=UPI00312B3723
MAVDNNMLQDYYSDDKLEKYAAACVDLKSPSISTRYYTLYSSLPSLKDKTVLDLPCGLGFKARKFILEYKASKVVGVDIVQKQLDVSRQLDVKAGVQDGQIEYVCHDAKIAKEICQADICVAVHLFCFAKNFDELVSMASCLIMNLKQGGQCYSLSCSLSKEDKQTIIQLFQTFDYFASRVDPLPDEILVPRRLIYSNEGFNYDMYAWDAEAIKKAFIMAGFSRVELVPYKADPEYSGPYNLEEYMKTVDGQVVIAVK